LSRPHRQVIKQNLDFFIFQDLFHWDRLLRGRQKSPFRGKFPHVRRQPVQDRSHLNRDPIIGKGSPNRHHTVGRSQDSLLKGAAHLPAINVKGRYQADILQPIAAEALMH
jgi:hypothetical protein